MSTFALTGAALPAFAAVDKVMQDYMTARGVTGAAVAVMRDGRLAFTRGYTQDAGVVPFVRPTSIFRLASISKPITRVAVERCFDDLDQLVAPIVNLSAPPGRSADPRWKKVTLRHLLDHTSSIPATGADIEAAKAFKLKLPVTKYEVTGMQIANPFTEEPGAKYVYSNYGYAVLSIAIERETKQTYEAYVRDTILAPLGIRARIGGSFRSQRLPTEVTYVDSARRMGEPSAFHEDRKVDICYGQMNMANQDAFGGWAMSVVAYARFAVDNIAAISAGPDNGCYAGTRSFVDYRLRTESDKVDHALGFVVVLNNDVNMAGSLSASVKAAVDAVPASNWPAHNLFGQHDVPARGLGWRDSPLTSAQGQRAPIGRLSPTAYTRSDNISSIVYLSNPRGGTESHLYGVCLASEQKCGSSVSGSSRLRGCSTGRSPHPAPHARHQRAVRDVCRSVAPVLLALDGASHDAPLRDFVSDGCIGTATRSALWRRRRSATPCR